MFLIENLNFIHNNMSGFQSSVKRSPYSPYYGSTYSDVARSFYEINKVNKGSVSRWKAESTREEFRKLMRHCSGK